MHCGIVIWSLFESQGGLERFGAQLTEALILRGHSITVFCEDNPKNADRPFYPMPTGVSFVYLPLNYKRHRPEQARKLIAESGIDVLAALFSWESLLWFPFLLRDLGIPLLVSEHGPPRSIDERWNSYEHRACLAGTDHVHVLFDTYREQYPICLHSRISVIPNPAPEPVPLSPHKAGARQTLLAAGRFNDAVKQFSLLVKAFSLLTQRFPNWDLEICGDGLDRKHCLALAASLGIAERVRFPGAVADMGPRYAASDLFCIPSRTEGFGLVTVEAYSHGLAVVGFADCPGVNEIIRHEENGLLATAMTAECLAESLARLMESEALRRRMGTCGRELISRFAPKAVFDQWEKMLYHAAAAKGNTRAQRIQNGTERAEESEEARLIADFAEILGRPHPYDRSELLRRIAAGELSAELFTAAKQAEFVKKSKRYGLTGLRAALLRFIGVCGSI